MTTGESMRDCIELIGIIVGVIFLVYLAVLVCALPFALIGWAIVTFSSLFGVDGSTFTYFTYAAAGLATVIVIGLFRAVVFKSG